MIRQIARRQITNLVEAHRDLLERAPTPILTTIASLLADAKPLNVYPGWRFAIEEGDPTPELKARLALWKLFRGRGITAPVRIKWDRGLRLDVILGNDQSRCLYVCGTYEPNEFVFLTEALRPG